MKALQRRWFYFVDRVVLRSGSRETHACSKQATVVLYSTVPKFYLKVHRNGRMASQTDSLFHEISNEDVECGQILKGNVLHA